MDIYELKIEREDWDNPEVFYIHGDNVFKLHKEDLESISLNGGYRWNIRREGNISLSKISDIKRYYEILGLLKSKEIK